MTELKSAALDKAILNALLREGRVTPGYLQSILRNRSSYVRRRLGELTRGGLVRYLGSGLYEPVRPEIEKRWTEALRREQAVHDLRLDPWEKAAIGLSMGVRREGGRR